MFCVVRHTLSVFDHFGTLCQRLKKSQCRDAFQDQHLSHATPKNQFLIVRPITNKRTQNIFRNKPKKKSGISTYFPLKKQEGYQSYMRKMHSIKFDVLMRLF